MRSSLKLLSIFFIVIILIGCSFTGPTFKGEFIENRTNLAEPIIYLYRPFKFEGMGAIPKISVNKNNCYELEGGTYYRLVLPQGQSYVQIQSKNSNKHDFIWRFSNKQEFNLYNGDSKFFKFSIELVKLKPKVKSNLLFHQLTFETQFKYQLIEVTKETAKKEMIGMNLQNSESNC